MSYFVSISIKLDDEQNLVKMIYLPIGMKSKTAPTPRSRPRAFDPDAALARAMHLSRCGQHGG
jgi:hypothetical protein